ncbi:MAG: hypothetical protein ABMA00_04775 [Gemmatimonas sp.]
MAKLHFVDTGLACSSIADSVFTVYVFARSVAGSMAPNDAAFQVPSLVVVPDVQLRTRPPSS